MFHEEARETFKKITANHVAVHDWAFRFLTVCTVIIFIKIINTSFKIEIIINIILIVIILISLKKNETNFFF